MSLSASPIFNWPTLGEGDRIDITIFNGVKILENPGFTLVSFFTIMDYAPKNASQIIGPSLLYNYSDKTYTKAGWGFRDIDLLIYPESSLERIRNLYFDHRDHIHMGVR